MNLRLSTTPDPGPKADDVAGEQQRRYAALDAVRVAVENEARVRDEAARASAARARDAVWCGASLADLAAVTGHSRQAARKRWSGLGDVQRRRGWLGRQTEGVMWATTQLLSQREALAPTAEAGFDRAVDVLDDAHRRVAALTSEVDTATTPAHWHALDDLVDAALRRCVTLAGRPPEATTAAFAVHGAHGVVSYYDHARRQPDAGAASPGDE